MAKKPSTLFLCTQCGHEEGRWLGKCPACGEWNSFKEMKVENLDSNPVLALGKSARKKVTRPGNEGQGTLESSGEMVPQVLSQVVPHTQSRYVSGLNELDRVLGGGIMRGSSILLGGEPGIGKSTLMLQAASAYQKQADVLYISGEESASHIKLRADRLGIPIDRIHVLANPQLEIILEGLNKVQPSLIIVDSVQTLLTQTLDSAPGTVNQMKMSVYGISEWARHNGAGVFFIAHVTKEGSIAGPKLIEHMVDGVLMFEHSGAEVRFLRAHKNRFGSVDEVGLFIMGGEGLEELTDPSKVFLVDRDTPMPPGVVAAPIFEGSRILVVEIQALTIPAQGGYGRVYSDRIDARRISRICAVLEKHGGIRLSDQDVYVNVAGGMKIAEVGVELPAALAIMSARTGQSLSRHLAVTGEVSLSGELRPVSHEKQRFTAAGELGFIHRLGPKSGRTEKEPSWTSVGTIQEAIKKSLTWSD